MRWTLPACCARAASGHAAAAPPSSDDELAPFQLMEAHSVSRQRSGLQYIELAGIGQRVERQFATRRLAANTD